MRCHYCSFGISGLPESCPRCQSYRLKLAGAGSEKLQEDLEELFHMKTSRIDSDSTGKRSLNIRQKEAVEEQILVCTKLTDALKHPGFSLAAIFNIDLLLNLPDFRSAERCFQEVATAADTLGSKGEVMIQTRMKENYLFRYLKDLRHDEFLKEEIGRRKELGYPPFSKLLLLKFLSKTDLEEKLVELVQKVQRENLEVLGPYCIKKSGRKEFRLLLKSADRQKLHNAAGMLIAPFASLKNVRVRTDVDPQST
jgi:primosomal protein N' (replication factor Y) (superfamily II helicase)